MGGLAGDGSGAGCWRVVDSNVVWTVHVVLR
jgi:hypothetical protein